MKFLITIFFSCFRLICFGQPDVDQVTMAIQEFHQALVEKNIVLVDQRTSNLLSYGHSNGWVETKKEMLKNLETGYIIYQDIKKDSLSIIVEGTIAHARFIGDINVTVNEKNINVHLKVLEVWVKKANRWLLFARQAVKI